MISILEIPACALLLGYVFSRMGLPFVMGVDFCRVMDGALH
jgi:hypothetical protein